ncbi:MAG TPA: hypothetical protein VFK72_08475 [Nevskia sp.]|nr:hypothetical protein [Nevskia sp.]
MSNESKRNFRRQQRADLGRLVMIGVTAAVMVGAARAVTAQDAPAPATPAASEAEPPAPAPAPASTPSSSGSRPSIDVSADAAVDFPGDI